MSWTPTGKVINTRLIAANILTFIAANQVEALAWTNATLIPFQDIKDSVANRTNPVYPSIALRDDNDEGSYDGDFLQIAYRATFEAVIENPNPSIAVQNARLYNLALCSMLKNMTLTDLKTGINNVSSIDLKTMETGFDEIKANPQQNSFAQFFEVRVTYQIIGAAY